MGAGELVEELTWHLQGAGWTPAWCMSPAMRHRLQAVFAVLEARQIPPEDIAWRLITHVRGRHAVEPQMPYAQRVAMHLMRCGDLHMLSCVGWG